MHLQKLRNDKASNDIIELLKRCSHPIIIDQPIWNSLDIPKAWGNSLLTTLWKGKGSKKDPSKRP